MRSWTILLTALFISGVIFAHRGALAEGIKTGVVDDRYGLGMVLGQTYKPVDDIDFYMLSGSAIYDHEKIWPYWTLEPLRFKVEFNIGAAGKRGARFMTSLNIFTLYYMDIFKDNDIRPYVEGGIGIIYTDFQVKGQGLRINFNPQLGIGMEFNAGSDDTYFLCIRHHHISNGGLNRDNRGVNSALLILGRYF